MKIYWKVDARMEELLESTLPDRSVYFVPESCLDAFIGQYDDRIELRHNNYSEALKLCQAEQGGINSYMVYQDLHNRRELIIISKESEAGKCKVSL